MITAYAVTDECYYVPLHLNIVFNSGCDFARDYPDDSLIDDMLRFAESVPYKFFVIDMQRVRTVGYIFDKFEKCLLSGTKVFIFYNFSEIIREKLISDFSNYFMEEIFSHEILSSKDGFNYFNEFLNTKAGIKEILKTEKVNIVGKLLKKDSIFEAEYLESSNIYANSYVNIKKIFGDISIFKLVIYDLCCNIVDHFQSADGILCVSNNGAAISSVIGNLLRKRVVYLMNLGPHITIKDAKATEKILPGEKFVFIYDFICLGTEFKIAKIIAKMRGAEILGGTGVACHLSVQNTINFPFMNINKDYDYGYKLFFDKKLEE